MSIDDDHLEEMDAAAGAMAYQLEQLEETNRIQWAEAELERGKLHDAEGALKELQDGLPFDQLELLRARQAGDSYEAQRLESEIECLALGNRLDHLNKIRLVQANLSLTARVNTENAAEANAKHLQQFKAFRDTLADQTKSVLFAQVAAAQEVTAETRADIGRIQEDLAALVKSKADLTVSGETFDQALDNVLLETKEEYTKLNKVNATIATLHKELETCERRSEIFARQIRGEENAHEALKKQAVKKGVISNALVPVKRY